LNFLITTSSRYAVYLEIGIYQEPNKHNESQNRLVQVSTKFFTKLFWLVVWSVKTVN